MIKFFKKKEKKKIIISPSRLILFSKNLMFKPISSQIIYIENSFHPQVNKFIVENHEEISLLFSKKGYHFCYIPFLKQNRLTTEVIEYYYPNLDENMIKLNQEKDITIDYDDFLLETLENESLHSGLLRYKKTTEKNYLFSYLEFTSFTESELWEQITVYLDYIKDNYVFYSIEEPEKEDIADFEFPLEAKRLVAEVKERIEKLKKIGINEIMINSLLLSDTVISRMRISKDYRIYLTDYNNKEIVMSPLPKAIFFLFLKHPEGILFKHLSEYKDELKRIYLKLTSRSESKDILESLNDVTDSTKNSINEKCSRIREAFVKKFDESLAKYYFITGDRATPKKIILDRKLVNFECDI